MNRDTLNLSTFDPMPLVLGERTTRLPAEPVNPRAAFEAFERGDHFGPAHATGCPYMSYWQQKFDADLVNFCAIVAARG